MGNELLVQPGAPARVPTLPQRVGPQLYAAGKGPAYYGCTRIVSVEHWVELSDAFDPEAWEYESDEPGVRLPLELGDWNKLGGTPLFLQGGWEPPGPGWRFAFQFTAEVAGYEIADGAECFGWVHDDGRGAFMWECH